jgi:protein-disulfide isomerase
MRTLLAVTAALALLVGPAAPARAQESRQPTVSPQFTLSAMMTKGPATAPVTIVEFSDYQ